MTTYYIRRSGSDSAAGTSPATAWLTLGKALNTGTVVVGGDTVYLGAGVYRESNTIVALAPSSEVRFVGDVDGAFTGDAGEVTISAYLTDDTTAPTGSVLVSGTSRNNLTFERLSFVTGSGTAIVLGTSIVVRECAFVSVQAGNLIQLTVPFGATGPTIVERCLFFAPGAIAVAITLTTAGSGADYDANVAIRNNVAYCSALASVTQSSPAAVRGGGVVVTQNTLISTIASAAIVNQGANSISARYPTRVINNVVSSNQTGAALNTANLFGSAIAENNRGTNLATTLTTQVGVLSATAMVPALRLELGQSFLWGLAPRPPFAPLAPPHLLPPVGVVAQWGATMSDDAAVGTLTWTNPGNAAAANDSLNATITSIPATTGVTHYLKALGGVVVPTGAVIRGVQVELLGLASAISALSASSVKLVKGGVIGGTEMASSNTTALSTSNGYFRFGLATDPLWGLTLTDTDVNGATFGVALALKNTSGSTVSATVDLLRVVVAYTADGDSQIRTVDLLNRPRPAGLGQTYGAIGALDRHDTGQRETIVTHGGAASLSLTGPADQQFDIPVDAGARTIAVWARYDGVHGATTKPQLSILAQPELGVGAATATMTAAADTWEQLSLAFSPTAKGVVTIRLASRAASGLGIAYFDDISLT